MFRKQEWEDGRIQVIPPRKSQPAEIPPKNPVVIEAKAVPSPDPSPMAPSPAQADPAEARQDNTKKRSAKPAQRFSRRTLAFGSVGVVALAAAGWFGVEWLTVGRFTVSTDDAYVQAYNTTLAAKVPGYVANVAVTDNTRVHAGDVIATIDDGDYRLAAESARNKVATQQATIARIGHQIDAQIRRRRAGKGATRLRAGDGDAHPARARSPEQARGAGLRQPPDTGTGAGQSRSGSRGRTGGTGRARFRGRQCRRSQGPAAGSRRHARRAKNRAGQGRARSLIHRDPRTDRRRDR